MSNHANQVRELFDSKAGDWPDKYAAHGRLTGRKIQFADAVRAQAVPGGKVLDLGCASGELARYLAAAGYEVTGCDIAPQMLRLAAAADVDNAVQWIPLSPGWQALPFVTGSLDVVVAASVLEYVPDPAAVLRECARVLRPGGILVCSVPDVAHPVRWLEWPLIRAARIPPARAAGSAWPALGRYLTYLSVSRQRPRVSWWLAAAGEAGLRPVPPAVAPARAPLRLLSFVRPDPAATFIPGRSHP
jgi:SAM-dependent methyltransferase